MPFAGMEWNFLYSVTKENFHEGEKRHNKFNHMEIQWRDLLSSQPRLENPRKNVTFFLKNVWIGTSQAGLQVLWCYDSFFVVEQNYMSCPNSEFYLGPANISTTCVPRRIENSNRTLRLLLSRFWKKLSYICSLGLLWLALYPENGRLEHCSAVWGSPEIFPMLAEKEKRDEIYTLKGILAIGERHNV